MRIHYVPPWTPISFEPARKPVKPRKYFHSDDTAKTGGSAPSASRLSDIMNEESEEQRTDILA